MGNTNPTPSDTPANETAAVPAKRRMSRKTVSLIAGGAAVVLIAAGAIAVPQVVHSAHVGEYNEITAKTNTAYGELARTELQAAATTELGDYKAAEARNFHSTLIAIAKTGEPALTKADSTALTSAAGTLDTYLKQVKTGAKGATLPAAYTKELKAKKQGIPADPLELNADQAATLLVSVPVKAVSKVSPDKVDGSVVDAARKTKSEVDQKVTSTSSKVKAAKKQVDATDSAIAATRPALVSAAKNAPAQAKRAIATTSKAGAANTAVTQAAAAAAKLAATKSATPSAITKSLTTYTAAWTKAKDAHTKKVRAELAAAGAAEGGYTDPGTGTWVPVDPGYGGGDNGGGWNNGGGGNGGGTGGGGGGGGYTPPAPGGGGNNGGGGGTNPGGGGNGGGGGGTPPRTSCPPGTIPTGSWDNINGVHCESPGNGGDTDGW